MIELPTSKQEIAELVPHQGSMCLIDEVLSASETNIHAKSLSLSDECPMRSESGLTAESTVEFAAQCAAIHAGITGSKLSLDKPAFLVSIKKLEWHGPSSHKEITQLEIDTSLINNNAMGAIYSFKTYVQETLWTSGTLTLFKN